MSLTLNMVGGGSGGGLSSTDALLRVQAPANSTVTITKGTTTKSDQGHESADDNSVYDYYFIIHASQFDSVTPWSVLATDPIGIVNTKTITIDSPDEYNLTFRCQVPDEYQEVEYLYSNRQGYIQTDRVFADSYDSTVKYEFKCKYMPTTLGTNIGRVFGLDPAATSGTGRLFVYCTRSSYLEWYFYNESNNRHLTPADVVNTVYEATLTVQNNSYTLTRNTDTLRTASFEETTPLPPMDTKFSVFDFVDSTSTTYRFPGRIYYALASINDVKRFELIPCYRKSDSVAGMYDRVNKVFLTNSGTGTFTVGADVS